MSARLRAANTETDNLISNLRGEVGEIITSWVLMREFRSEATKLTTGDIKRDFENQVLTRTLLLIQKLEDEIVARLSELAEEKIGRLNFFFAAVKLKDFNAEALAFKRLIVKNGLRHKRNRDISHKELPEQWVDHRHFSVPYRAVLTCTAAAVRLMKQIDRGVIGPAAPCLWREARKRRRHYMLPPKVGYLLLPHLNLSPQERCEIVLKEIQEGRAALKEFPTVVNGKPASVLGSRNWGVLLLDGSLVGLPQYPLNSVPTITFDQSPDSEVKEPTKA